MKKETKILTYEAKVRYFNERTNQYEEKVVRGVPSLRAICVTAGDHPSGLAGGFYCIHDRYRTTEYAMFFAAIFEHGESSMCGGFFGEYIDSYVPVYYSEYEIIPGTEKLIDRIQTIEEKAEDIFIGPDETLKKLIRYEDLEKAFPKKKEE